MTGINIHKLKLTNSFNKPWAQILLLTILCFVLYFINLNNTDLVGTDEARYAEVAREMVVDHQWIIPHLNAKVYTAKPPMFFWFISILSKITGNVTETTACMPAAISTLAIVLTIFLLGTRLKSQRVGFIAALILVTNLEFLKFGRLARLDLPFTLFITLSLTTFYFAYTTKKKLFSLYWFLGFWLSMALAGLTKGPLGFILPFIVVITFLIINKDIKLILKLRFWSGSFVFLFAIGLWIFPAYFGENKNYGEKNIGDGVNHLIHQWNHMEEIYYYIPELALGLFPWSFFMPGSLIIGFFRRYKFEGKPFYFSMLWFVIMFFVFSLSMSKRHSYILPLYPACALLIALFFDYCLSQKDYLSRNILKIPMCLFIGVMVCSVFLVPTYLQSQSTYIAEHKVYTALILCFLSIVMILLFYCKRGKLIFILVLAVLFPAEIFTSQVIWPARRNLLSEKPISKMIKQNLDGNKKWAAYKCYKYGLTFYTESYPKILNNVEELETFLNSKEKVFVLCKKSEYINLIKNDFFKSVHFVFKCHYRKKDYIFVTNTKPL